ncbi:hypothetical protein ODV19_08640 [Lactobacillus amylovorus]|uniref:YcaO domain-containing protein n=1 Tax=Lactobacillus amylovorus TaxID=1604 RepID=A0AAW6BBI8_LACAM|nr:hypothetical protein [Lactobacillus amylovorus]MDA6090034.1 hypothetical protein [Lactobacillus amylovorus]MDB6222931.1 hypothetical protein [Lactobacillus amylovorus]MDB6247353.1 hypothetical protein [Lactobacillus amylovorus]UIK35280.1 hypothetical protein KGE51_01110 [Lactobacillus amylovorus]
MDKKYVDHMYVSNSKYLDKRVTGIGSIYTVHCGNRELPYTTSAQGKNLHELIRKIYSEFSERIGFGCYSYLRRNTYTINLKKLEFSKCITNEFGIGYSPKVGSIDTTGTAAGTVSKNVIEKAVFELLEKNELYFFWYLNYGKRLERSRIIDLFLKRQGMEKFENYFFEVQTLSLYYTVIYISIKNNHIVTTGISCTPYRYKSIQNAIAEAKIIYMFNLRRGSFYLDLAESEHKEACKFIEQNKFVTHHLKGKLTNTDNILHLKLSYEVKDLKICLNTFFCSGVGPKLVSAISSTLLKCTPFKNDILQSKSNSFLKRHPCPTLQKHVDCVVV